MENQHVAPAPHVQAFVEQLLNAGDTLVNLVENLVGGLVANGSVQEEATGELVAALIGTVAVRMASIPESDFVRATELMQLTVDGVLDDLRRAEKRARRRRHAGRRGGREARRSYPAS